LEPPCAESHVRYKFLARGLASSKRLPARPVPSRLFWQKGCRLTASCGQQKDREEQLLHLAYSMTSGSKKASQDRLRPPFIWGGQGLPAFSVTMPQTANVFATGNTASVVVGPRTTVASQNRLPGWSLSVRVHFETHSALFDSIFLVRQAQAKGIRLDAATQNASAQIGS
jgi:hypothetical protein